MLIVKNKEGGGIFDFGKILLKKALSSNLIRKASKAINSNLGKQIIKTVKVAADTDLGKSLKRTSRNS